MRYATSKNWKPKTAAGEFGGMRNEERGMMCRKRCKNHSSSPIPHPRCLVPHPFFVRLPKARQIRHAPNRHGYGAGAAFRRPAGASRSICKNGRRAGHLVFGQVFVRGHWATLGTDFPENWPENWRAVPLEQPSARPHLCGTLTMPQPAPRKRRTAALPNRARQAKSRG